MKINYFPIMCAVVLFMLLLTNCSAYKSTSGLINIKDLEPVRIVDSELLYSTYKLTGDDKESLRQQWPEEVVALVEKYAHEKMWPPGIDDFKSREAARAEIGNYKAYVMDEFAGKMVLIIPAGLNEEMPAQLRPGKDIFFIIGKEGVVRD